MSTQATARLTAGCLVCCQVRDFLKSQQFAGRKIEFLEGSGWVSRMFTIKGDLKDVEYVYGALREAFEDHHD